jgi:hypothetical protein
MNTRLISALVAAAALTAGHAHAFGEAVPFSTDAGAPTARAADVRAEAVRAQRAGEIVTGETGVALQAAPASSRTRADVRAEAAQKSERRAQLQQAQMPVL